MAELGDQGDECFQGRVQKADGAVEQIPEGQGRAGADVPRALQIRGQEQERAARQGDDAGDQEIRVAEPVDGPAEEPGREHERQHLDTQKRVDLAPGQQVQPERLLAGAQARRGQQGAQVPQSHLEPALRPALALGQPEAQAVGGQFFGDDLAVVRQAAPGQEGADADVNVLGEHGVVEGRLAQRLSPPVAVGPAEDARAAEGRPALVRDGIRAVELDADGPRQPVLAEVANHAPALHHVVAVREPAPGAAEAVGGGPVVGVKDAHDLAGRVHQSGVDVLGLGAAALDFQKFQAGVAVGQGAQVVLDGQGVRRVVGQDDLEPVGGHVGGGQVVRERLQDDLLLVRQVGGDDGGAGGERVRAAAGRAPDPPRGARLPEDHQAGHGVNRGDEIVQAEERGGADPRQPDVKHRRERDHEQQGQDDTPPGDARRAGTPPPPPRPVLGPPHSAPKSGPAHQHCACPRPVVSAPPGAP